MLNGIQILRGLAAYGVVYFHISKFLHFNGWSDVAVFEIGRAGVDLFFVISGFVMVYITPDDQSPMWFFVRRIARIVPLYWFATLMAVVVVSMKPWMLLGPDISIVTTLASLLFIPFQQPGGEVMPTLFVGWTLNYEMFFYALFAVSMFLPARTRVVGLVALLTALILVLNSFGGNYLTSFYGNPIMLEFAAGCLIGVSLRSQRVRAYIQNMSIMPLLLPLVAAAVLSVFVWQTLLDSILVRMAVTSTIVATVAALDLYRQPFAGAFFSVFGDHSYSAYLLHPFIVEFVGISAKQVLGVTPLSAVIIAATIFVGTAIVSQISYNLLEYKSNQVMRRQFARWIIPVSAVKKKI